MVLMYLSLLFSCLVTPQYCVKQLPNSEAWGALEVVLKHKQGL
jgi:hypothetical protein